MSEADFLNHLQDESILSLDAARRARAAQTESRQSLCSVLVSLGILAEDDLVSHLSSFLKLPVLELPNLSEPPAIFREINAPFLRAAQIAPFEEVENTIRVAVADPFAIQPIQAIGAFANKATEIYLTPASNIARFVEAMLPELEEEPSAEFADGDVASGDIQRLLDLASEAPIIRLVNSLIAGAIGARASDIHIEPMEDRLDDTHLDAEQREFVSTARNSSQILLTLIDDLLDLSKVEAGKLELENTDFDPRQLVQQCRDLFAPTAQMRGVEFHMDLSDFLEPACGDAGRIRQILFNLISNALKFTSQGEIRVHASSPSACRLHFDVSDTGIGIPLDRHAHIFDRFHQTDAARNRRHSGVGLGLAICKELVELMDGEIGLETVPSGGTRFWFEIPVEAVKEPFVVTPDASEQEYHMTGRILLAEDSPTNAFVARSMLEKAGLRIDHVANGLEALEAVRLRPYDLVLMDVSMPIMDGLEATCLIRGLGSEHAQVPIIAMTAHALRGDRAICKEAGMNGYVSKPIAPNALFKELERLLPNSLDISPEHVDDWIDTAGVKQVWGNDMSSYHEVASIFQAEAADRIAKISRARQDEDIATVKLEAHSLKGAASNVGGKVLSVHASALERLCKEQATLERIDEAIIALKDVLGSTLAHLSAQELQARKLG